MVQAVAQWLDATTGLGQAGTVAVAYLVLAAGVIVLSVVADFVARRLILRGVSTLIERTQTGWDDALLERGVFSRLSHLAPAIVVYLFAQAFGEAQSLIERFALAYMIVVSARVVSAVLDGGVSIYQTYAVSREKPIRGYAQLVKILLYLVVAILLIAVLLEREPWGLLTGLGAMSAVLLLVFRDSILGFVASVQLASNDMVRCGDWIEMPKYGADGDVLEVSLHTVKVQNWDKTITTIPTQALITDAFKNWRGMTESGGRRIKRALLVDAQTIRLCDDAMLERFERFALIRDYVERKRAEIAKANADAGIDTSELVNGRRLTNIGTFRAYIEAYLRNLPVIHREMTFLVRQLAPTEKGVPIEIYVFSSDQNWVRYEGIQSDIFDHLLAVAPRFDLRIYQEPSGHDLREAAAAIAAASAPAGS